MKIPFNLFGKPQTEATPEAALINAAIDALIICRSRGGISGKVYDTLYEATRGMIEAACDRAYGTYRFREEAAKAVAAGIVGEAFGGGDDDDDYEEVEPFSDLLSDILEHVASDDKDDEDDDAVDGEVEGPGEG